MRNKRTHAIPGGFWYENRLSQNGKLSSLDVMVAQAGASGGSSGPGGGKPGGFGAAPGGAAPGGFGAAPGGAGAGSGKSKTTSEGLVIDVLYVDAHSVVRRILADMPPNRFGPMVWRANSVIELPAGSVRASGTEVGDRLAIGPERP